MTQSTRSRQLWLKTAALGVALAALGWTFRDVQGERVVAALARLGVLGVGVALLPQAAGIALDTLGWRTTFATLGARAQFRPLLWTRLATEALALVIPGGAVVAEPLKVPLLGRHAKLESSAAIAGIVARKYLVLAAQSGWLAVATVLALTVSWRAHAGGESLLRIVVAVALASLSLGVTALGLRLLLSRGTLAIRVKGWLSRVPSAALQEKLLRSDAVFRQTDGKLARFFAERKAREAGLTLLFGCAWATEALETYLFLRLLGVELDFGVVAMMEVALTLLRNLTFLIPAGIGVQDLGYALFLRAFGVSEATELAAAFTLLKRGKELLLVALGLGLLSTDHAFARSAGQPGAARAPAIL